MTSIAVSLGLLETEITASRVDRSSTILTGWVGCVRLSLGSVLSPLTCSRPFILWLINHTHWMFNFYQEYTLNPGWVGNKQYLTSSYLYLKTQDGEDEKRFWIIIVCFYVLRSMGAFIVYSSKDRLDLEWWTATRWGNHCTRVSRVSQKYSCHSCSVRFRRTG